jgi:hypothetical protein
MRVGWLFGPPAVGKSTAAWQLYRDLAASGVGAAYVDIDQLGMCYPARPEDPDRDRLKGRVLAALLANYAAAGADVLVVSGVLDPALIPWLRDVLAGHDVSFARLALGDDELHRRLQARGADAAERDEVRRSVRHLEDARPAEPSVDTDGRSPQEVAVAARSVLGLDGLPAGSRPVAPDVLGQVTDAPGQALWVCGPVGVGKSLAGWAAYQAMQTEGADAAFLDLAQLGFAGPLDADAQHALQAANVAAAWGCFHAAGATHLVLSGAVDSTEQAEHYRRLLPSVRLTLVRLRADRDALARRVHERATGAGPRLAGDRLVGQPAEVLDRAAQLSWAEQRQLDAAGVGDVVLDTTGATVAEVGAELVTVAARRTA